MSDITKQSLTELVNNIKDKNLFNNDKIFEIKNYIFDNLNNFIFYNTNQKSLINAIKEKLIHE